MLQVIAERQPKLQPRLGRTSASFRSHLLESWLPSCVQCTTTLGDALLVVPPASERFRMLGSKRLLEDGERLCVERGRASELTPPLVKNCQVVEAYRHIGMLWPQRVLLEGHGSLEQIPGLVGPASLRVLGAEVVEGDGDLASVGSRVLAEDLKRVEV